jgi:exodeoxyribonuclease VII large subunit
MDFVGSESLRSPYAVTEAAESTAAIATAAITLRRFLARGLPNTATAAAAMVVPDQRDLVGSLDRIALALRLAMQRQVRQQRERLAAQAQHLRHPRQVLRTVQLRLDELSERAVHAITGRIRFAQQRLRGGAERLQALSPLAVLERGYSIARRVEDGAVVRDAAALKDGECLRLTFARGTAHVRVEDDHAK